MADRQGVLNGWIDKVTEKLSDLLGQLAPEPDAIPIPVRNRPRDPRGRRQD